MSSNYEHSTSYSASEARLNSLHYWTSPDSPDSGYYLEVKLLLLRHITHIATQGGSDYSFVSRFYIRLSGQGGFWQDYTEDGKTKVSIPCTCETMRLLVLYGKMSSRGTFHT